MKLKKIIIQYILAFFVLTASFYWMYDRYFSTEHNITSAGPQENYAWAIAKFAIKLAAFEAKTERQLRLGSTDKESLQSDLDLLFSGSNVLLNRSDSTRYLYLEDDYGKTISAIHNTLEQIDSEFKKNSPDFNLILRDISVIRDKNLTLIAISDHAEVRQRTNIYNDYINKGNSFKVPIIAIYVILILMLLISFKQLTSMNNQLESEKKAFNNKNAFLGKLGHELKTTLQAIVSSIEVIMYAPDNKANQSVLLRLESAVSQIEQQMNDLAEYAKIDNGSLRINNSSFNISDLITRAVSECNSKFRKKNLLVKIQSQPSGYIKSDPIRLNQIIENLLTNAFKYTENGEISLVSSLVKDRKSITLCIEIHDTGIGIDKEQLKTIFQPFVRIDNGVSKVPGSGMGLAIVDGIVKAMNGQISVVSNPGEGSCFTVRIPVEKAEIGEHNNDINIYTTENKNKGIRVLYIDDNELTCSSMLSTLNGVGYQGEAVSSVNRAIEKLNRIPYDVVLSDLQMPIMSGYELLILIRNGDGPNKNTPFVFISAYSDEYQAGETPLITKPARISDINKEINKILNT
ncbi:hybrid sensor histidine kinase/response regulator [Serratia marcescens]|uniref:ATP-binding response regulator n=1 Tax=Serratia marcescens TaxID=615 RepID=UPI003204ECF2